MVRQGSLGLRAKLEGDDDDDDVTSGHTYEGQHLGPAIRAAVEK
jgi:hypothetical protein